MILTGKLEKDFTTWLLYHDVIIKHGGSDDDIWHNEDVTIYGYFDKLPKIAGEEMPNQDFFNKLNRPQKVFYCMLVFNGFV